MDPAWQVHEVEWPADASAAVQAFAAGDEIAWLDSAVAPDLDTAQARYSLVCARPLARLVQYDGREAAVFLGHEQVDSDASGWCLWRRINERLPRWPELPNGLAPGWVGYVAFEVAQQLERLPASHREDLGLPLMRMALFDRGIVLDHHARRAYAVVAEGLSVALGLDDVRSADEARREIVQRWHEAMSTAPPAPVANPPRMRFEIEQAEHERMVRRALEYIAAGDIYQVNLAQRLLLEGVEDVLAAYAALRSTNPAPYAALLHWPDGAIASVSPELFLRLRGRDVLTCPIKGTRPRTRDADLDEVYRHQLLASEKDAAELAMIIDLHRNDLGRVCAYGSVQVAEARRIETHPRVFHTVADVVGRLAPDRNALDLLTACFPAGSISGVPKIRALEIIDELESVARGAYTGAVGVLGLDGQMMFNVAIRTLQVHADLATLYVGGGIVADSDPTDEYEETLVKARGILEALQIANGELRTAKGAPRPCATSLRVGR